MKGACTIVSPNYLPFARTLAASYKKHHPGQQFFVLIVADIENAMLFANEKFTTVLLKDLQLPNLRKIAMKYAILELNTNIKPTFMKYLLAEFQLTHLSYLDPDISVYCPLSPVFSLLDSASIVLTPHLTSPLAPDGLVPGEQDMLYNGTYNLGFISVRSGDQASKMLDWWEERCLNHGFSEARTGLFVDQKWINLVPGYFSDVAILRHSGCNMAYWNLHERELTGDVSAPMVNQTVPLCFYHFSGITLDDSDMLSVHTNRFTLTQRPDLRLLFSDYKERLKANRVPILDGLPYKFDSFVDGARVTLLARRMYAKHEELQADADPFDVSSALYAFCKRHGLISRRKRAEKPATWRQFDPRDRRVRVVNRVLKLTLKILGPDRYELLLRYLSYISVLRNQSIFIRD